MNKIAVDEKLSVKPRIEVPGGRLKYCLVYETPDTYSAMAISTLQVKLSDISALDVVSD